MNNTIRMLLLVFVVGGCVEEEEPIVIDEPKSESQPTQVGCTPYPDAWKGEAFDDSCAGAATDDIRCCSYGGFEEGRCYYTVCRSECRGAWEESQFSCQ